VKPPDSELKEKKWTDEEMLQHMRENAVDQMDKIFGDTRSRVMESLAFRRTFGTDSESIEITRKYMSSQKEIHL
jgi:hypothetical protein